MSAGLDAEESGVPRQPETRSSILRGSLSFLIAGAVLVTGVIIGALTLAERSYRVFDAIVDERGVRRAAVDLLSAVQVAESSQRGYLLSGDPARLAIYDEALIRIPALYGDLRQRVVARDGDTGGIGGLEQALTIRLDALAEVLNAFGTDGVLPTAPLAVDSPGAEAMERMRVILEEVMATADARIAPAIADQRQTIRQLLSMVVAIAAIVAAIVGGSMILIARRAGELARAQADLRALNATLEERVNLRTEDLMRVNQEVQRFAYIVTHDLRAPLVNIMGFTSELETATKPLQAYVLAEGGEIDEQVARDARIAAEVDLPEAIGFIRASAAKMDGLINAILKISRDGRRQLRPERIDLEDLVQRATEAVGHQILASEGNVVSVVEVPSIIGDRLSLDQILGNLLDNAVKYADPNRPLQIAVRVLPAGRRFIRIEVEDNGRGIAPEDQERIFELFRRAGRLDRTGEGVGLAHVRSLARNLGGEITVRSTLGEGSTFILRLPVDLRKDGDRMGLGVQWASR